MTGGSIGGTNENDANTADRGGGVCVDCGKFTMSASADGQNIPSITGNNATENGGGVYVIGSSSTFEMTGGSITGNNAAYGGGVCVSKNGSFEMSGSSCITNNKADSYGGGVNINYASATFTMKGGSITGNNAYKSDYISTFGGGVCVGNGTFTMTDGSITGNNAAYGGGVYTVKGRRRQVHWRHEEQCLSSHRQDHHHWHRQIVRGCAARRDCERRLWRLPVHLRLE